MAPSVAAIGVEAHGSASNRGVQSSFGLPSSRNRNNAQQENQHKHLDKPSGSQVPNEAHSVGGSVNAPSKDSIASRLEELLARRAEYTRGLMSVHNVGLDFDAMTTMGLTLLKQANETEEEECEPRVETGLRARLINGMGVMSRRNRFGLRPSIDGSPGMSKDDYSVLQRLALVAGDESMWKMNQDKFAPIKRRQDSIPEVTPGGSDDPDTGRWARKELSVSRLPDTQQQDPSPAGGSSYSGTSQGGSTQQAQEQYQLGPGMGYSGGLRGRSWVSGVIKLGRNGLPLHPGGHWQYDDGGEYDGLPGRCSAAGIGDGSGSSGGGGIPPLLPDGESAAAANRFSDAAGRPDSSNVSQVSPGDDWDGDSAKDSGSGLQVRSSDTGELPDVGADVMNTPVISVMSPMPPMGAREANRARTAVLRRLAAGEAVSEASGRKGSGRGARGAGRRSEAIVDVSKQRVEAKGNGSALVNGRGSPWPPDKAARAAEAARAADTKKRLAAEAAAEAAAAAEMAAAVDAAVKAEVEASGSGNRGVNGQGSPLLLGSAALAAEVARIRDMARDAEEAAVAAVAAEAAAAAEAAVAAAAAEAAARAEEGSCGSLPMSPVDCMTSWTYLTNNMDGSKSSAPGLRRNRSAASQVRQRGRPSLFRNATLREFAGETLSWDSRPATSFSCTEFEVTGKGEGASVRSCRTAIGNNRQSIARARTPVLPLLERGGQGWESAPSVGIVRNPLDVRAGTSAERGASLPRRTRASPLPGLPVSPRQPAGHSSPLGPPRSVVPPILHKIFICVGEGMMGDDSGSYMPYGNPLQATPPAILDHPRRTASPIRQRFDSPQPRGQTPLHTRHAKVMLMPFSERKMFSCDESVYPHN